jgi:hypothetical protein
MPAQGGEETQILEGLLQWEVGVTAKGAYFMPDYKTIQFLDATTGKVRTISAPDKPSWGLCVSPDGAYVVYAQIDRYNLGLMLVDGFR